MVKFNFATAKKWIFKVTFKTEKFKSSGRSICIGYLHAFELRQSLYSEQKLVKGRSSVKDETFL